jgi:hypothetical protein
MQPIDFSLSHPQLQKLSKGKPIQLKHSQIGTGIHRLYVNPMTHKKVSKAYMMGKGVRIQMSAEELAKNGEGFKDFLKGAWKGIKKVYNVLKPVLSPLIRQGLSQAAKAASVSTGIPISSVINDETIAKIGNSTGAFGLKKRGKKGGEVPPFMLNPANGALAPYPDGYLKAPGMVCCPHCGGGFRPAN